MRQSVPLQRCFNCGQSDAQSPLVALQYAGKPLWICPSCMPVLIHHTAQLTERLSKIADQEEGGTD